MSVKTLRESGVTLTWNQKCSCYSFNLPPRTACPDVYGRMKKPRSICNFCYAYHGRFGQSTRCQKILSGNLDIVLWDESKHLAETIVSMLMKRPEHRREYFRWFGSGDVINETLLSQIITTARLMPDTKFWVPTQLVAPYKGVPKNLVFRRTQHILGLAANHKGGMTTLLPGQNKLPGHYVCPGKCDGCRVCWEKPNVRVAFPFHGSCVLHKKLNLARKTHGF